MKSREIRESLSMIQTGKPNINEPIQRRNHIQNILQRAHVKEAGFVTDISGLSCLELLLTFQFF